MAEIPYQPTYSVSPKYGTRYGASEFVAAQQPAVPPAGLQGSQATPPPVMGAQQGTAAPAYTQDPLLSSRPAQPQTQPSATESSSVTTPATFTDPNQIDPTGQSQNIDGKLVGFRSNLYTSPNTETGVPVFDYGTSTSSITPYVTPKIYKPEIYSEGDGYQEPDNNPYGGFTNSFDSSSYAKQVAKLGGYQLGGMSPMLKVGTEVGGLANPYDLGVAMNQARLSAIDSLGGTSSIDGNTINYGSTDRAPASLDFIADAMYRAEQLQRNNPDMDPKDAAKQGFESARTDFYGQGLDSEDRFGSYMENDSDSGRGDSAVNTKVDTSFGEDIVDDDQIYGGPPKPPKPPKDPPTTNNDNPSGDSDGNYGGDNDDTSSGGSPTDSTGTDPDADDDSGMSTGGSWWSSGGQIQQLGKPKRIQDRVSAGGK